MKLERHAGDQARGKYAVVRLRDIEPKTPAAKALARLTVGGHVEFGNPGDADEFFVIKLKDKYAFQALLAYANAAQDDDPEYAADVRELANRAINHPLRKKPD
jgi:hypothetical protein